MRTYEDIYTGATRPNAIRELAGLERVESLAEALRAFPALRLSQLQHGPCEIAPAALSQLQHFLVIHRLHVDQVRGLGLHVPDARFVLVEHPAALSPFIEGLDWVPAIVQRRVHGTALWEMYSPEAGGILLPYKDDVRRIAPLLRRIVETPMHRLLDWYPMNFILDAGDSLHYIDSKPTVFAGRSENDHNLSGIRMFFLG
jgi:hypothetical protein